jgi:hypothetical protein
VEPCRSQRKLTFEVLLTSWSKGNEDRAVSGPGTDPFRTEHA